jgi:hypothetical protein
MNVKLLERSRGTAVSLAATLLTYVAVMAGAQLVSRAEEDSWAAAWELFPGMSSDEVLTVPLPSELPRIDSRYGRTSLQFERNDGQVDSEVKFLARGPGYHLFLTQSEAVMVLSPARTSEGAERLGLRQSSAALRLARTSPKAPEDWRSPKPDGDATVPQESPSPVHVLRMRFVGGNSSSSVRGEAELWGKVNYFTGNDPSLWRTNISTFAEVRCQEVYPGIDLAYYGTDGQLEYDFVVAPGVDPNVIALEFEGADEMKMDGCGDLIVRSSGQKCAGASRWPISSLMACGKRLPGFTASAQASRNGRVAR